jgi:uncharacterized membrane protein
MLWALIWAGVGERVVVAPISIWSCTAGVVVLCLGVAMAWRRVGAATGVEKLVALGWAFVAAPLAVFGAEHLTAADAIQNGVPEYMPWHLFWAYFVGVALIAAALSISTQRLMRWSGLLCGCMIALFVAMVHAPSVMATHGDRIRWIVLFRDLGFASGLWALAAGAATEWKGSRVVVEAVRIYMGALMIFFGVEHVLFPLHAPGVPLEKITPRWVPAQAMWGYLVGALLVVGGAAMVANLRVFSARTAAIWLGLVMQVIVIALYLPILLMASGTGAIVEGVNYVGDTMLMGGCLLVVAGAMKRSRILAALAVTTGATVLLLIVGRAL